MTPFISTSLLHDHSENQKSQAGKSPQEESDQGTLIDRCNDGKEHVHIRLHCIRKYFHEK